MYNEKVMDHFTNPRNVGDITDADGVGEVGNPTCGDIMRIAIKVGDGRIRDIKFRTFGCGAAIATSSMVTELVKGKTLDEALDISNRTVAEALGGLPAVKMHCSNLAADALHKAIDDYRARDGHGAAGHDATHDAGRKAATAEAEAATTSEDQCGACCGKIGKFGRELLEGQGPGSGDQRAGKDQHTGRDH